MNNPNRAALREPWLERLESYLHCSLIPEKGTPVCFASPDGSTLIVLHHSQLVKGIYYWFGFTEDQKVFLDNPTTKSFLALGCGSIDTLLLLPYQEVAKLLPKTNFNRAGNKWYIRIHLESRNRLVLHGKGKDTRIDITKFLLPIEQERIATKPGKRNRKHTPQNTRTPTTAVSVAKR